MCLLTFEICEKQFLLLFVYMAIAVQVAGLLDCHFVGGYIRVAIIRRFLLIAEAPRDGIPLSGEIQRTCEAVNI